VLAASTRRRVVVDKDRTPEETLHIYESAFRTIKDSTGIEDLGKLVDRFVEVEDQNFSLYNFVNELNREIETLREQVFSFVLFDLLPPRFAHTYFIRRIACNGRLRL
jgi:hypothetical protein